MAKREKPLDLVAQLFLNVFTYKDAINCAGNPNYPAADSGHIFS